MIFFPSARKLSSYLDRAKLSYLEKTVVSFQCKRKRCQTCHNVKKGEIFTSTTTDKTFKTNHKLTSSHKCLVYFLTSKLCLKQNFCQILQKFRFRCKNYQKNQVIYQEFGTPMQQHLYEHFSVEGHRYFLKDVSITLIDKDLIYRKRFRYHFLGLISIVLLFFHYYYHCYVHH